MLKKNYLALFAMLFCMKIVAQQDKLITHFIYDKMSINPGKTGVDMYNSICATSLYRNQWDKVNGAPNSAILNVEANLSKFFPGGVGLAFYHDAIGFARQNNLLLNYSYPISIGNNGTLGIGVGVGIINYGMNPEWVPPSTLNDPDLPLGFAATNLDANFGLYYSGKDFNVGFSTTHLSETLLKQSVTFNGAPLDQNYQTARHYYLMGGKTFRKTLGGDIDAQILLRTDLVKFSGDINARYIYTLKDDKQLYGGLTFRTSDAFAVMVGYTPISNLTVGYSYDLTLNKLANISRGSHEMVVKYCMFLKDKPVPSARHPRWL
jgi:type IX secretion system PorP/SprF family membrane protein